jgi:REP element-mobilizing transposase RayT
MRQHLEMDSDRVFFITTVTAQRQPIFRREAAADLLIETLAAHYRDERKYLLHEFVIMPDHVPALITPSRGISLEQAVQIIKGGFFVSPEGTRAGVAGEFQQSSGAGS